MRQIVGSVQLGSIEGRFGLLLSLEWSREEGEKEREGVGEGGREKEGKREFACQNKFENQFFHRHEIVVFHTRAVLQWKCSLAVLRLGHCFRLKDP